MDDASHLEMLPDSAEHLALLSSSFQLQGYIEQTERRAITPAQLKRVVDFASTHCRRWHDRSSCSWTGGQTLSMDFLNLYHLTDWVILPATQAGCCAMVELLTGEPQAPTWFVSHWWGEPLHCFVSCIGRHAQTRALPDSSAYWVCAYANRQHSLSEEVTSDPRQTSFFRALTLSEGVLLILDDVAERSGPATPFKRIWCAFEEYVALSSRQGEQKPLLLDIAAYHGSKPEILSDGVTEEDERLARQLGAGHPAAKVRGDREKHFPLEVLKAGLSLELEKAQASQEADRVHILNAIAGRSLDDPPLASHPSYTRVNQTLRGIFAVAGWRQAVERGIVEALDLTTVLAQDEHRTELNLDFTGSILVSDAAALEIARGLPPKLESLGISCRWCTEISHDFLIQLAPALPATLTRLSLNFGFAAKKIAGEGLLALSRQLPRSLRELHLDFNDGYRLGTDSAKAIGEGMPPALEVLSMGMAGWTQLGDSGLAALAQSFPPTLQKLTLNCFIHAKKTVIGDAGLAALGAKLGRLSLLDLNFKTNTQIGDPGLSALGASLPKTLESLRLVLDSCSGCKDAGLAALSGGLPSGLKKLQLFFNECPVGDAGVSALAQALPTDLQHLELSFRGCTSLGDGGLAALGRGAPRKLSLVSLALAELGRLSGRGLAALAQGFSRLEASEALHVCLTNCTEVCDGGVAALGAQFPSSLKSLTLDLDGCGKISDAGFAGLSQRMPPGLDTLRCYFSGCPNVADGGFAALSAGLPESLRYLELEPATLTDAGLAALRNSLASRQLQLKLDVAYTDVNPDLAAELIGNDSSLETLRRWQPSTEAALPTPLSKAPPPCIAADVAAVATAAPPAAPLLKAVASPGREASESQRPSVIDVQLPKAAPAAKSSPAPKAKEAARPAAEAAKTSSLSLCGASIARQQPRQPPKGGLLANARASKPAQGLARTSAPASR